MVLNKKLKLIDFADLSPSPNVTWREAWSWAWTVKQVEFVFKIRALHSIPLEFRAVFLAGGF